MKEIHLSQGKSSLVSEQDFDFLNQWGWTAEKNRNTWYATRDEGGKKIYMHRVVANAKSGENVDHIDRNGLSNWRENLRVCSNAQNAHNRSVSTKNKTGYKGVFWHKKAGKYAVKIEAEGKRFHLGLFVDVVEAAKAYDRAAIELHGEFARLNFQ